MGRRAFNVENHWFTQMHLKLRCDERFTYALTACVCVFKVITLVGSNQRNYFENATTFSKRTLKTTVATQLRQHIPKQLSQTILQYEAETGIITSIKFHTCKKLLDR